jgi:hypothetical protein
MEALRMAEMRANTQDFGMAAINRMQLLHTA